MGDTVSLLDLMPPTISSMYIFVLINHKSGDEAGICLVHDICYGLQDIYSAAIPLVSARILVTSASSCSSLAHLFFMISLTVLPYLISI